MNCEEIVKMLKSEILRLTAYILARIIMVSKTKVPLQPHSPYFSGILPRGRKEEQKMYTYEDLCNVAYALDPICRIKGATSIDEILEVIR